MRSVAVVVFAFLASATLGSPGLADSHEAEEERKAEASHEEPGHAAHEWHRNHVGVFLGGAYRSGTSESGFVVEAEYEFRPFRYVGFGAVAEHTFNVEGDPWLLVLPLTVHPYRGLRLYTGPGLEWEGGRSAELTWRVGVGWDFAVGRGFVLTPAVNADWADSHWNYSYGVQVGYAF